MNKKIYLCVGLLWLSHAVRKTSLQFATIVRLHCPALLITHLCKINISYIQFFIAGNQKYTYRKKIGKYRIEKLSFVIKK